MILAHLVSTGVGPFYDGAAHFFASVEEVLPVLGLALLAGLRGTRHGRIAVLLLPLAWLAGGLAGIAARAGEPPELATATLLIATGALLAWDRPLSTAALGLLAVAVGLWCGYFSGGASAGSGLFRGGLAGAVCGVLIVTLLGAGFAAGRTSGWSRVAVRVAGSWLAALGLLALGWSLRGGGGVS
jgi:hypothetical protein